VFDALAGEAALNQPAGDREATLHLRLARHVGVPPSWLTLADGLDELLGMVLRWRREAGAVVLFPPDDPEAGPRATGYGVDVIELARGPRLGLALDPATLAELPPGATALATSPNDPVGSLLGSQDAVRMARGCAVVVIDERHVAYAGRTLVPLAREFENLVVLQSFETWAGLAGLPLAYAVAPPRLTAELARYRRPDGVATGAVVAALATLDDLAHVQGTVARVREEKGRLYRTLRKLNMLSVPYPSWGNFLLARIERGDATLYERELARRGILVHRPPHPALRDTHLRISATFPEHTLALKEALVEIAAQEL
jgi:histidinol-phosphate aminotransferase